MTNSLASARRMTVELEEEEEEEEEEAEEASLTSSKAMCSIPTPSSLPTIEKVFAVAFTHNFPQELQLNCFSFLERSYLLNTIQVVSKDWRRMVKQLVIPVMNLIHYPTIATVVISKFTVGEPYLTQYVQNELSAAYYLRNDKYSNMFPSTKDSSMNVIHFNRANYMFRSVQTYTDEPVIINTSVAADQIIYQTSTVFSETENDLLKFDRCYDVSNRARGKEFIKLLSRKSMNKKHLHLPKELQGEYNDALQRGLVTDFVDFVITLLEKRQSDEPLPDWMKANIDVILSDLCYFMVKPYRLFKSLPYSERMHYLNVRCKYDIEALDIVTKGNLVSGVNALICWQKLEFLSYVVCNCELGDSADAPTIVRFDGEDSPLISPEALQLFKKSTLMQLIANGNNTAALQRIFSHYIYDNVGLGAQLSELVTAVVHNEYSNRDFKSLITLFSTLLLTGGHTQETRVNMIIYKFISKSLIELQGRDTTAFVLDCLARCMRDDPIVLDVSQLYYKQIRNLCDKYDWEFHDFENAALLDNLQSNI